MKLSKPTIFTLLVILSLVSVGLALSIGSVSNADATIIYQLRLPRVLAAFAVGGLLAMSGSLLQVLTRNPLAEPSIIGVSGGASVGSLAVLMMGGAGTAWVAGGAWIGALVVMVLLWKLVGNYSTQPSRFLLAGVMIATGCGAISTLMISFSSNVSLPGMIHWLMGDLDSVISFEAVIAILLVWLIVLFFVWLLSPKIHLLQLGTDKAMTLGVNVASLQWIMVLLAALSAASAVSVAGSIGFVGLLVPHILRALIMKQHGPDQRFLLPASAFLGGSFLVISDMFARTIIAPSQLPVGVITALIGVPSFLWLLSRLKQWNS